MSILSVNLLRRHEVHRTIEKADRARDRKDWLAAYRLYGNAVGINPTLPHIWVQRGHSAKEMGRVAEAINFYKMALTLDGNNADTFLQLGHAYKMQGDRALATDAYLKSYEISRARDDAFNELSSFGWSEFNILQSIPTRRSPETLAKAPMAAVPVSARSAADYRKTNDDVDSFCERGLVVDAEQHYRLYGYREGRVVLETLAHQPVSRIFVLCPSVFKQCGIGEYARYTCIALQNAGYEVHAVRSTRDLRAMTDDQLRDAVVIVNHGPGLFDGYNPRLSEGESTSELITTLKGLFDRVNARPIVYLHSLLDADNVQMYGRQRLLLESDLPTVTTIQSAAGHFHIPWVDHGVQPIEVPDRGAPAPRSRDNPKIGFFGFFQWGGKDFDALFNAAEALRSKLVGSVATVDDWQLGKFTEILKTRGVHCDIGTGWVSDEELATRLSEADFFYLPQMDYDHWNNSGTARFVTNLDRPLILPPHNPFLDMRDVAIFAEEGDVPAIIAWMRDDKEYADAVERIRAYRAAMSMVNTGVDLVKHLPVKVREQSLARFPSQNALSLGHLFAIDQGRFSARMTHVVGDGDREVWALDSAAERNEALSAIVIESSSSAILRVPRVDAIEIWRRNYDLLDFVFPNIQDCIFALFRNILKREPSYIEYYRLRSTIPHRAGGTRVDLRHIVTWLAKEIGALLAQSETHIVAPEISIEADIIAPARIGQLPVGLIGRLANQVVSSYAVIDRSEADAAFRLNPVSDRNVFVLLALPSSIIADAFSQVTALRTTTVDYRSLGQSDVIRERYVELLAIFAKADLRLSEFFIFDHPIAGPIDPRRTAYAMSDFAVLDGDMFIVNLVRSLMKRDPLTVEMFAVAEQLSAVGKLATVAWFVQAHACNASVIDLAAPDAVARQLAAASVEDKAQLYWDFRSVVSGGWQLRNAYLETKRNNSRAWLRMKRSKDLWWQQGGHDTSPMQI